MLLPFSIILGCFENLSLCWQYVIFIGETHFADDSTNQINRFLADLIILDSFVIDKFRNIEAQHCIMALNDLQILVLTCFLGLFILLVNYLVKFFRSAAKSAEEQLDSEVNKSTDDGTVQQVAGNFLA